MNFVDALSVAIMKFCIDLSCHCYITTDSCRFTLRLAVLLSKIQLCWLLMILLRVVLIFLSYCMCLGAKKEVLFALLIIQEILQRT